MNTAKNKISNVRSRNILQKIYDWLFGYDFFISYRWSDGAEYASNLAEKLKEMGYVCFLDSEDFVAGGRWNIMGRQAIKRTSRLILIATKDAIKDPEKRIGNKDPIFQELSTFVRSGRHKIRITFDEKDVKIWQKSQLHQFFKSEELYLEEDNITTPNSQILNELSKIIGKQTQVNRRATALWSTTLVLFILLGVSLWKTIEADKQKEVAEDNEKKFRIERDIATARSYAIESELKRPLFPEESIKLAIKAVRKVPKDVNMQYPEQSLRNALALDPGVARIHLYESSDRIVFNKKPITYTHLQAMVRFTEMYLMKKF